MREIAQAVQEGAAAYLRRQFRTLAVFAVIVFLVLLVLPVADGGWGTRVGRAVFFLIGAGFSASVGFIGMTLATRGNVRVAAAARAGGYRPAFRIAYRTGGVCAMISVGLGLFGAALALLLFDETAPIRKNTARPTRVPQPPSATGRTSRTRNTITAKTASVRNCRLR